MRFQFLNEYYKKKKLQDFENEIFIDITEAPSWDIKEEDYSLRIGTCTKGEMHRKYAIEHHADKKHSNPHLQFKFHSENIGSIWINLIFEDEEEYQKGVEGFIFHSKNIFLELEDEHPNLSEEMLYLEKVALLAQQGGFLHSKVTQSIQEGLIEFQDYDDKEQRNRLIQNHELLNAFVGEENARLLLEKNN